MRKSHIGLLAVAFLMAAFIVGCGGGSMNSVAPAPQSSQVSLSMTDAPPAGVSILSFEVSVTGASLNPGNADLLAGKGPIRIEVKNLETDNAFLSTANVAAGTYTSLNLTFTNPEITFMNNTGAALAGCAVNAVCKAEPKGTLTATVNGTFNVTTGTQMGVLVDLNVADIISSTLGVDFSGSGPVYALGNGVVTEAEASGSGWPGGGWITYQLTSGPARGLVVYLAEDVTPDVQVGQTVTSATVIGNMFNGSDGIETGWAMGNGSTEEPESQAPEAGSIGADGPFPTIVGLNFDELLQALGAPAAPNAGQAGSGVLPQGYPTDWNALKP